MVGRLMPRTVRLQPSSRGSAAWRNTLETLFVLSDLGLDVHEAPFVDYDPGPETAPRVSRRPAERRYPES